MKGEDMIRVMLVDDQELIRTGFELVLRSEQGIDVVAEAGDGQSALNELERLNGACDVLLIDVRMPGMNGIETSAEIVRRFPATRVLVLTTFDLDEYAISAIQAGASGFLLKDVRPGDLIDAIHRVADGDAVMDGGVTRRLVTLLSATPEDDHRGLAGAPWRADVAADGTDREQVRAAPEPDYAKQLTEREIDVLSLLAEGKNNAEICAELFVTESTVKTHLGRVLSKLHLRDRVHAVIYARTHGLQVREPG